LHVIGDHLVAPGHVRVDPKHAGILLHSALHDRPIDPSSDGIGFAADIAIQEIELQMVAVISPSGRQEPGGGGHESGSVDHGSDGEVHVVGIDELSTHRPVRRRGPLRPGGRDGAIQGAKIGHLDTVEETRHSAAGDDLQTVGSVPFCREPLHRAGRQVEARLQPRHADVRGIHIAQGIVGLPTSIKGHAALPERNDAALALLGGAQIGTSGSCRGIE
jgi:hypothetical protein